MLYYTKYSAVTEELNGDGLVNGCGLTLDANLEFLTSHRQHREVIKYLLPPVRKTMRSRTRPVVRFPFGLIPGLESVKELPCHYVTVLSWLAKKEFFYTVSSDPKTSPVAAKFKTELVSKMSILLTSGQWIDEPSDLFEENLNTLLRKIDLGRCSFLKHSSQQTREATERMNRFRKVEFRQRQQENMAVKESYLRRNGLLEFSESLKPAKALEVAIPETAKSFGDWKKEHSEELP